MDVGVWGGDIFGFGAKLDTLASVETTKSHSQCTGRQLFRLFKVCFTYDPQGENVLGSMALETAHFPRASSPSSSGRASPANPRPRAAVNDGKQCRISKRSTVTPICLGSNRKDKTYRRYASGIERALSLFDTALQEWADYISFLGRLHKVQIHLLYPRKLKF